MPDNYGSDSNIPNSRRVITPVAKRAPAVACVARGQNKAKPHTEVESCSSESIPPRSLIIIQLMSPESKEVT